MNDRVVVDLAVNDPANGQFAGECDMLTIGGVITLEGDPTWVRLCNFEHGGAHEINRLFMCGCSLQVFSYRQWVGNWCWDAVEIQVKSAAGFMQLLRESSHWTCTEAESDLFEAYQSGQPLFPALKRALSGLEVHGGAGMVEP